MSNQGNNELKHSQNELNTETQPKQNMTVSVTHYNAKNLLRVVMIEMLFMYCVFNVYLLGWQS